MDPMKIILRLQCMILTYFAGVTSVMENNYWPHEILFFSFCIKSTIVVFKMTKQLSEEKGGVPVLFVSRKIIRSNIIKRAK